MRTTERSSRNPRSSRLRTTAVGGIEEYTFFRAPYRECDLLLLADDGHLVLILLLDSWATNLTLLEPEEPELRIYFRYYTARLKDPDQRALGDHYRHGIGLLTYGGGGEMTSSKAKRDINIGGTRFEVAGPGNDYTITTDHKTTVELSELFQCLAHVGIVDVADSFGVAGQGI